MELKVSKEITWKWQNQRFETNKYVSWALFLKLQTAEINFEKLLGWTVFKNPNFNPFQSSSVLPMRGIRCICCIILTFLSWFKQLFLRKSQCEMLIGGDRISNDVITLGTCFSMFVYIRVSFRFALIDDWWGRGKGGGGGGQ